MGSQDARVGALQRYFDALCEHNDVVGTAAFQAVLGMRPPGPIKHLRVRRWMKFGQVSTCGALLDILPEGQETENSAVAEMYHIVARIVVENAAVTPCTLFMSASSAQLAVVNFARQQGLARDELYHVADIQVPAREVASRGAYIDGLPLGAHIEFEVKASNALGRSLPVTIRSIVLPELGAEVSDSAASVSVGSDRSNPQKLNELSEELADLSRKLEEKEQEVLDLQFDMAGLMSRIPNSEDDSFA